MKYQGLDLTPMGKPFLYTALTILLIAVVRPPYWVIVLGVGAWAWYSYYKRCALIGTDYYTIDGATQAVYAMAILVVLYYAWGWAGAWGIIGVILLVFVIVLYRMWVSRQDYLRLIRWWEKTYLGQTAEERNEKKRRMKE